MVQANGTRTQFTLVYQNRLTGPQINPSALQTLQAQRGKPLSVSVEGQNIQRVTVLAPWGERVALSDAKQGAWQGTLTVPENQATGTTALTVILLDGAHNRTEVTLDLEVR